ncbi:hypothetical protein DLE60_13335 [Micromonospora globispora]|uniref:hypothetical protein n=1 Tax=Micromonospora globispora TaxID=1450148 RepID=UPI000D6F64C2|nr:hypothetical protein [Micromonospora globispora]PWU60002.1 hypothetical protein DLE60_13335 [Micromonospora globispora]RQW97015.1 hypothetical protein DKL51_12720 [Micromonospora globispora]
MIDRKLLPAVALLLVPALAACSIGDVRRTPPTRAPRSHRPVVTTPAPLRVVDIDEVRRTRLALPQRYGPPFVEFVDAGHGYALFASCDGQPPGRDCTALLYSTVDGGRSWQPLPHPRPVAEDQQLYAAPGVLALLAEPYGWYTSTDGGASFTHTSGSEPPVLMGARGRFQVIEGQDAIGEWDGGRLRPLAAQPSVPGLNSVGEEGDLLVAAGADGGRPYAAISRNQGRSWRTTPVPVPDGEVAVLRTVLAPDGGIWLIGERPDRTGFPAFWRFAGPAAWARVGAVGHPAQARSVAPIGAGLLAVTGPDGVGVVAGGRYYHVDWPLTGDHYLTVLVDGTIAARGPDDVILGIGWTANRRWVKVTLDGD